MLKAACGTINANEEPLFLRVYAELIHCRNIVANILELIFWNRQKQPQKQPYRQILKILSSPLSSISFFTFCQMCQPLISKRMFYFLLTMKRGKCPNLRSCDCSVMPKVHLGCHWHSDKMEVGHTCSSLSALKCSKHCQQ